MCKLVVYLQLITKNVAGNLKSLYRIFLALNKSKQWSKKIFRRKCTLVYCKICLHFQWGNFKYILWCFRKSTSLEKREMGGGFSFQNIRKCPTMPRGHQMDSDTRWPELLNCEITFELPTMSRFLLALFD